ncbi:hypothetical protein BGW42_002414 [Actinomortierella wolfii]|nr:hypothetical protein BGW42_002414 [Actinomortierella wolfii]
MGRVTEVLCAAASSSRVYIAARVDSQLYLIRSASYPSSFTDARWELFSKEPLKDTPDISPSVVSCAAGDDNTFVIMGVLRYSEQDFSSRFWGASYNYDFEVTRKSQWKDSVSSLLCKTSDSCNHMVLVTRSRVGYQSRYVHIVYQDSVPAIQISPFAGDGFNSYTTPLSVNSSLSEMALFTYLEGGLTRIRISVDKDTNTMPMNVETFAADLMGIPAPNSLPATNATFPLQQYCYVDKKTIGKLGGAAGDKVYFWCQSFRENSGIYEVSQSNMTKIADVTRSGGSYDADSYLPAPVPQTREGTSPSVFSPTWGLVLRDGMMYSVAHGQGASGVGVWQNAGQPHFIDLEGISDGSDSSAGGTNPLSHVAVAFIAIGSVLALALAAILGFWLYRRRYPKEPSVEDGGHGFDGLTMPLDHTYLYTPPWNSAISLPPPYTPPEQPLPDQSHRTDEVLNQDDHTGDFLTPENPSAPPPSVESGNRNSRVVEVQHELRLPLEGEILDERRLSSSSSSNGESLGNVLSQEQMNGRETSPSTENTSDHPPLQPRSGSHPVELGAQHNEVAQASESHPLQEEVQTGSTIEHPEKLSPK